MKIIFMGTPEFAVETLRAISQSSHEVVGVITAPDRPAGRGRKLQPSAVKQFALEQNLTVLQPTNLKDPGFLDEVENLGADIFVVVAFRMLPKVLWNMPPQGTFNLHASLLPQYRGAAPINHAIINGETETGVTTFFINENIDTGSILFQEKVNIAPHDNTGSLHDKLMHIGANLVVKTLEAIEAGTAVSTPQPQTGELKEAPKIFKEDCFLDFRLPTEKVHNKIRGLSPYPGAIGKLQTGEGEILLKILETKMVGANENAALEQAGNCIIENGKWLIRAKNGVLSIEKLQWPGKKPMATAEFLKGYRGKDRLNFT